MPLIETPPGPTAPAPGPAAQHPVAHDPVSADLVSVVVPCYQAEVTIGAQLAALAAQDAPGPYEVVVVDNGSRDGTLAVLAAAQRDLPGLSLRVVRAGDVRGAGPARNAGVRVARGSVLAFCDADDVVGPSWVREVRRGVRAHGFVAGRLDGRALNDDWVRRARRLDQQDGLQRGDFRPWLPHAAASDLGVRRDLFDAVDGFDPRCRHLEDTDLCWRIQLVTGVPLVFWPGAVVSARLRSGWSGMLLQGWHYGVAAAQLRRRWAPLALPAPAPGAPAADDPPVGGTGAGAVRGALARWRSLVPARPWDRGALGHALWQGGWRLGWWLGRRGWAPGPVPPPVPTDLAARGAAAR